MSIVSDFKSIRRNVERLEQKVEFEAKNPKPVANPVVWTPEWGYGTAVPLAPLPGTANLPPYRLNLQASVKDADDARLQLYQMYGLGYQGEDEPAPDVSASSRIWHGVGYIYDFDRKEIFAVGDGEKVRIDNRMRFKDWAEYKADPEAGV